MSVLAILGIAKWGRVAALVGIVATSAAGGGFWAGKEWTEGRRAQAEVVDLRADATALREAANELRQSGANAAQDMRTSARRMDAISIAHQEVVDGIDRLLVEQREALDSQIDSAAAADLRACRIGNFGMRIWAEAATGGAAVAGSPAGAASANPWWLEGAVPPSPADADQRFRPGGVGGVPAGGSAVLPLPEKQGKAGGGGE
jgi:hypothetical protein